jgi:hypothetical protein
VYIAYILISKGENMIEISKNIPIPESKTRPALPYKSMEIGDSFHIEGTSLQAVCNSNYRAGKKLGMKFIAKKDEKGIRVWRMA